MTLPPGSGSYGIPAKVVDASVLAALIFGEPRAGEADSLLQGAELHAPHLLAYELTRIAQRKVDQTPAQRVAFEEGLETALAMNIRYGEINHAAVLQLALQTNLTTYDACYLYLSRALGATLATFDRRLQAAASALGI